MFKEKLDFKTLPYIQNQVLYFLYKDDNKYKWNSINFPPKYTKEVYKNNGFIENSTKICFSSFSRQLKDAEDTVNRMIFIFEESKSVPLDAQRRWLLLCKKNALLPKYASVNRIMSRRAIVLDLKKHTMNMLYTYLTVCRFMQEDPCMVLNTLVLVEDYGMDFLVALTFATQIRMNNMGHHFMPGQSIYIKPKSVDDLKDIKVAHMAGLYRFIQQEGPNMYDKSSFNANSSIESMSKIQVGLRASELLHPSLAKIIRMKSDEEILKALKKEKLGVE